MSISTVSKHKRSSSSSSSSSSIDSSSSGAHRACFSARQELQKLLHQRLPQLHQLLSPSLQAPLDAVAALLLNPLLKPPLDPTAPASVLISADAVAAVLSAAAATVAHHQQHVPPFHAAAGGPDSQVLLLLLLLLLLLHMTQILAWMVHSHNRLVETQNLATGSVPQATPAAHCLLLRSLIQHYYHSCSRAAPVPAADSAKTAARQQQNLPHRDCPLLAHP
jgi:hypothetical protein